MLFGRSRLKLHFSLAFNDKDFKKLRFWFGEILLLNN